MINQSIVIYKDEGVGEFGFSCLQNFFSNAKVTLANASQVVSGECFQKADIFVMPGGADLPYAKKLNGAGNKSIRAFVEGGGTYLGICAGAYYASREIAFHKGREDEICETRELALIDCVAIGSIPQIAPYYDDTLNSAAITNILLKDEKVIEAYYHGGCYFDVIDENTKVIARYESLVETPPAIITKNREKGRVILSGVHLEATQTRFGNFKAANHLLKELLKA
jgi:glutamine amidotransferase-like uncharacterized protein